MKLIQIMKEREGSMMIKLMTTETVVRKSINLINIVTRPERNSVIVY
ncbi:hypothetical protein [Sutcliffiella horikoshii]|nr:hypothetical protein [Sutcliffiella horikoshii]